jgi:hypothetical protein
LAGTLYDLEIQVKQSKIINAGMGAFLTFKGARVPKKKRLLEAAVYDESDYISHPTKELHSEDFSIELGCYGPMLETGMFCSSLFANHAGLTHSVVSIFPCCNRQEM